jgi:hypothetical protein
MRLMVSFALHMHRIRLSLKPSNAPGPSDSEVDARVRRARTSKATTSDEHVCTWLARSLLGQGDNTAVADEVFKYCLKQACCAPLELAAAAFSRMGAHLGGSPNVGVHRCSGACANVWPANRCRSAGISTTACKYVQDMLFAPVALLAQELSHTRVVSHATLVNGLDDVNNAIRRPGLLQRADELIEHSTGRVLLALATAVVGNVDDFR